jgi:hypothetical protein
LQSIDGTLTVTEFSLDHPANPVLGKAQRYKKTQWFLIPWVEPQSGLIRMVKEVA